MALLRRISFLLLALLALGIAIYSYRYLLPGPPGGAPGALANRFTHLGALTVHAGFAATALMLGPFQFFGVIRRTWPRLHRWMGTIYVIACLIGGTAGLILALGTTAGPVASLGFGSLAVVWIACTTQAWRFARARDLTNHERWMIRSFSLTLAAVTLRLYLPAAAMMGLDMGRAYVAISFLCWIPNLAIAEWMIAARASNWRDARAT